MRGILAEVAARICSRSRRLGASFLASIDVRLLICMHRQPKTAGANETTNRDMKAL